jgi:hypothetical protein
MAYHGNSLRAAREGDTSLDAKPLVDPVCGMAVEPDAEHRVAYLGRTCFFCSGQGTLPAGDVVET